MKNKPGIRSSNHEFAGRLAWMAVTAMLVWGVIYLAWSWAESSLNAALRLMP
jgi:hypothetical protein